MCKWKSIASISIDLPIYVSFFLSSYLSVSHPILPSSNLESKQLNKQTMEHSMSSSFFSKLFVSVDISLYLSLTPMLSIVSKIRICSTHLRPYLYTRECLCIYIDICTYILYTCISWCLSMYIHMLRYFTIHVYPCISRGNS